MTPVDPLSLTPDQVMLIRESLSVAPKNERLGLKDVVAAIYAGDLCVFAVEGKGLLVCQKRGSRVNIVAFAGPKMSFELGKLGMQLKGLAADWGCDAIETTVYDERLARAIQAIGGYVESWNLLLEAEG